MEMKTDYELLKQAYAIIDGIPETAIAFGGARTQKGETLAEGTICSPEGWLALHPTFNELGLTMSADGQELRFNGQADSGSSIALSMAKTFGLPLEETEQLFGDRRMFTNGDDSGLSDKRLWQRCVREYLQCKGQLGATVSKAEFAGTVKEQVGKTDRITLVEDAAKNAVAGSEYVMAAIKFAIDSTNAGYEQFTKTTRQAVEAVEANMDMAANQFWQFARQTASTHGRDRTRKT